MYDGLMGFYPLVMTNSSLLNMAQSKLRVFPLEMGIFHSIIVMYTFTRRYVQTQEFKILRISNLPENIMLNVVQLIAKQRYHPHDCCSLSSFTSYNEHGTPLSGSNSGTNDAFHFVSRLQP